MPRTLVDTSARIAVSRNRASGAHLRARLHLAGARDDGGRDALKRLLSRCDFLPTEGPPDYEDAAAVYRTCRRSGATVRRLTDCLIAAVAMRHGVAVLHSNADFDAIARHLPLEIA